MDRCKILKEISPEYLLEGLMLKMKLQYFDHLMGRTDSLEKILMLGKIEDRGRRGWQRMRWLDGHESEQALGVGDGQGSLVCCSPWDCKESDMTEQLNWTALESLASHIVYIPSMLHFQINRILSTHTKINWSLLNECLNNRYCACRLSCQLLFLNSWISEWSDISNISVHILLSWEQEKVCEPKIPSCEIPVFAFRSSFPWMKCYLPHIHPKNKIATH